MTTGLITGVTSFTSNPWYTVEVGVNATVYAILLA